MVGIETRDDAGVYRLDARRALVCTTDFFAPVVDDPYDYGRIAAANALSDVWAMGGRPLVCLNLVAFPSKTVPLTVLGRILAGGGDVVREAGAVLLGGHSIEDPEPKYGLAVVGEVHPQRVFTNVGARAGDVLVLTKPLGSGIATTAIKQRLLRPAEIREVVEVMATLNRGAGEVLAAHHRSVRAVTDVTGFGLVGHLLEMLEGAPVDAEISYGALPRLRSVQRLLAADVAPGGTRANLRAAGARVQWRQGLGNDASAQLLVADAQTSGGLLASVSARAAPKIVAALRRAAPQPGFVAVVGRVLEGRGRIRVVP
jgi:selenide,water dikinase